MTTGRLVCTLVALSLCGCAVGPGSAETRSTQGTTAAAPSVSTEQIAAINAASARQSFAGHYFDRGVLYLAFDASGIGGSGDLAGPTVRTVEVKYNLQELAAAEQRTLALVNSNPAFGTLAVLVDKRRNGIVVDSVTLVSGGNGGCRNRPPLPSHDPVNGVPIFDERDC